MNLRTSFTIDPSPSRISYSTSSMFTGSCFASEIGKKMDEGKLPVLINPFGSVYNPLSVANTLDLIVKDKKLSEKDLYFNRDQYLSFYHSTEFTSDDSERCLSRINEMTGNAHYFLSTAKFLFVTFGTARIYRFKETGNVVSNCHKLPAEAFNRELLSVEDIASVWRRTLDELHKFNNDLKVIFTISPVRHWKDGAHGNQVSKSTLFLAVEELLRHPLSPQYFPAYELVMDDLRDYRFYNDDMLHPSSAAVNYIWNAFSACFMENKTLNTINEVLKITKACNHRLETDSTTRIHNFAELMLTQISVIEGKISSIDLSTERNYFQSLLK